MLFRSGYFNTQDLAWGIGDRMYSAEQALDVRRQLREGSFNVAGAKEEQRVEARSASAPTAPGGRKPTGLSFGLHIVSCERGMLRHSQHGLLVYDDNGVREIPIEAEESELPEIKELITAIETGREAKDDGRWGLATLEVLCAIMQSGRERREIMLEHQVPARGE